LWLLYGFLSLKNEENVPLKSTVISKKTRKNSFFWWPSWRSLTTKLAGSESGNQRYWSVDLDTYRNTGFNKAKQVPVSRQPGEWVARQIPHHVDGAIDRNIQRVRRVHSFPLPLVLVSIFGREQRLFFLFANGSVGSTANGRVRSSAKGRAGRASLVRNSANGRASRGHVVTAAANGDAPHWWPNIRSFTQQPTAQTSWHSEHLKIFSFISWMVKRTDS
jgi:hypothetical protein